MQIISHNSTLCVHSLNRDTLRQLCGFFNNYKLYQPKNYTNSLCYTRNNFDPLLQRLSNDTAEQSESCNNFLIKHVVVLVRYVVCSKIRVWFFFYKTMLIVCYYYISHSKRSYELSRRHSGDRSSYLLYN